MSGLISGLQSSSQLLPDEIPQPRLYIMEEGRAYPAHICIPQPDGLDAYIEMHNVNTVSKMFRGGEPPSQACLLHRCVAQYVFPAPPSNIVGTGHSVYATVKAR